MLSTFVKRVAAILRFSDHRYDNWLRRHHTADLARKNSCFVFLRLCHFLLRTSRGMYSTYVITVPERHGQTDGRTDR